MLLSSSGLKIFRYRSWDIFNVSAYPSEGVSSVVLVEGSVNVKNQQKEQVILAPGQLVDIETGRLHSPRNVDVEPYVCWVKNMLMYVDEPLDKVFRKLNFVLRQRIYLGIRRGRAASFRKTGFERKIRRRFTYYFFFCSYIYKCYFRIFYVKHIFYINRCHFCKIVANI